MPLLLFLHHIFEVNDCSRDDSLLSASPCAILIRLITPFMHYKPISSFVGISLNSCLLNQIQGKKVRENTFILPFTFTGIVTFLVLFLSRISVVHLQSSGNL